MTLQPGPQNEEELEERLSRPTAGVMETLSRLQGDLLILGVAGKMGPTLARMARRACDELGVNRRVIGAARFSDPRVAASLQSAGVETHSCDMLDPAAVARLPEAACVIFMAGQKFGATGDPELTWAANAIMPALAARRFAESRILVFSTGCVYPIVPVSSGGAREADPLEPLGEYANSCVARERIFAWSAREHRTPLAFLRLNYAVELRYGVLLDVALKVAAGEPVDLGMGHVNVIWQGDANARAIQLLEHAAFPPLTLNVTGPETVSVRELAQQCGELLGRQPVFSGEESSTALLSNAGLSHRMFGYPTVPLEQAILWVAAWVKEGGPTLKKPTHFETRDGRY